MTTLKPRLENWMVISGYLLGNVYGDNRFSEGEAIHTTYIHNIDFDKKEVTTLNTTYRLGKKHGETDTLPSIESQIGFVF